MIEVEKKFQPTEEQLNAMLAGGEFLGEKVLHDVYYDYADYRMFKKGTRLRNRDGRFELKIGHGGGIAEEIETDEEIKFFLGTNADLGEFIKENMMPFIDYTTRRRKYKNGEFEICVDEMSFGLNVVEVELMVASTNEVKLAEEKIIEFGKSFGLSQVNGIVKRAEYFRIVKPELYKELCEEWL